MLSYESSPLNEKRVSRRAVLGAGAALAAATCAGPLRTTCAAETVVDQGFASGWFFDIHTHIGTILNDSKELTVDELLRWMDAHRVAQAAVLPVISPEASSYPMTTDFVLAQTKPHRDRLVPFCVIDPRTFYVGRHRGLVDMLKRYKDAGARGFGEHKPGVRIDDPRNMAIYAACQEVGLPILFHLDEQRNIDLPGLPGLEKVLKQFTRLPFIGHGPGWWASISGDAKAADLAGYPVGRVTPGGAIDVLMDKYPNLYGDLSAGSGAGALKRDLEFARSFLVRRADRLLFGTDMLAPGQENEQFTLFRVLNPPAEAADKIRFANSRRLLGLS